GDGWRAERWTFRRERLYLVPGDSPLGLRLPLGSIEGDPPALPEEEPYAGVPDPRRADERQAAAQARLQQARATTPVRGGIRSALCVEVRGGRVHVFLPPLPSATRFCELVRCIDETAGALDLDALVEGYPPPRSPDLTHL